MANIFEKSEEAAGITGPAPARGPYEKGHKGIPEGGVARPFTGTKPWADKTKSSEPAHGKYEHNSPAKPL